MRMGAALSARGSNAAANSAAKTNRAILPDLISDGSFRAHAGERIDRHELICLILPQHALGRAILLRRLNRAQNDLADQDHTLVRSRELLAPSVEQGLSALTGDVFGAHAAAKRRILAPVVGLFLGLRFDLAAGR